jgi:antirestriction protein ArdC
MQNTTERKDVYSRITAQIVEYLEKGVRPWIRPWNAEHAAGRITRPLRFNGQPYSGINVLSLWMSALSQSFAAPIWMTPLGGLSPCATVETFLHVENSARGSLPQRRDARAAPRDTS